jgi:hypothetical protein
MNKKIVIVAFIFSVFVLNIYSQENTAQNFFQRNLNHRVYLGLYSSYFDDNIKLLQGGYDCVLNLIHITPDFNLIDFGIGLNMLLAFDQVNESQRDIFGNDRPSNMRITPGIELKWTLRLYVIPIPKIDSRIYIDLEGLCNGLIVYFREFPDNGTHFNLGSHLGLGIEYPIGNFKAYTTLRMFHSSNGKSFENNPAVNAVGIMMGLQFK